MDCIIPVCVRDPGTTDYCNKHQAALDNIEETMSKWQISYGEDYTRKEYLDRLAHDFEIGSGEWVIEVAEFLLERE